MIVRGFDNRQFHLWKTPFAMKEGWTKASVMDDWFSRNYRPRDVGTKGVLVHRIDHGRGHHVSPWEWTRSYVQVIGVRNDRDGNTNYVLRHLSDP